ncbi:MAG: hypothetical protein LBV27_07225 [Oscillospiraceae bacterium]|jgi:hypothetical protein|nr:hypothetical protein [Oscillospiraceae bacterium]
MDSLKSFLYPVRKGTRKFPVSNAFRDEEGNVIEWELRELTSQEALALQSEMATGNTNEIILTYAAESLVYPDLHDAELLKGLSEREGRPILKAKDALVALTTDAELARIYEVYLEHNRLNDDFDELVEEAKN